MALRGSDQFPIVCSCGKSYDKAAWQKLPKVGDQKVPAGDDPVKEPAYVLELRNCSCKSTIAFERPVPAGTKGLGENVMVIEGIKPKTPDDLVEQVKREHYPEKRGWSAGGRAGRGEGRKLVDEAVRKKVGHHYELEPSAPVEPTPPKPPTPDLDGVSDERVAVVLANLIWDSKFGVEQRKMHRQYWHPGVAEDEMRADWWRTLHHALGITPDDTDEQFSWRARVAATEDLVRRMLVELRGSSGESVNGLAGGRQSNVTYGEIARWLTEAGFVWTRKAGSHNIWKSPDGHSLSIPGNRNNDTVSKNVLSAVKRALRGEPPRGVGAFDGYEEHVDAAFVAAEDGDWDRCERHLNAAIDAGYPQATAEKLWKQLQGQYGER